MHFPKGWFLGVREHSVLQIMCNPLNFKEGEFCVCLCRRESNGSTVYIICMPPLIQGHFFTCVYACVQLQGMRAVALYIIFIHSIILCEIVYHIVYEFIFERTPYSNNF